MRVLLVSSSSGSRGGGELFLLYLGQGLRALGHDPVLWASSHEKMDDLCSAFREWGEVVRSDYKNTYDRWNRSLPMPFQKGHCHALATTWKRIQPDVIHINKQNLEDGLDLIEAANATGRPSVCTIHLTQTAGELGAFLGSWRDHHALRMLEAFSGPLISVSRSRMEGLLNVRPALSGKLFFVPNGVPTRSRPPRDPNLLAQLRWSESDQIFCTLGRLVPQKGPSLFLRTARSILAAKPEAKFLWIGGGPSENWLRQQFAAEKMSDRLAVTGWVNEPTPWLALATVYLHPARYEGLPLSLLEAMQLGLPSWVQEEVWSELEPPLQTVCGCLPRDISAMIEMPLKELERRGAAAAEVIALHFSIKRMIEDYLQIYEGVLR